MKTYLNHFSGLGRAGSVLVTAAFAAIFMIGLTALVTDVGWMYFQNARIQTAVNAGWKAGYDRMTQILKEQNKGPDALTGEEKTNINQVVLEMMKLNGYTDASGTVVTAYNPFTVRDTRTNNLFFARLLNFNTFDVSSSRVGEPTWGLGGVVPLAIPHGVVKDLSRNTFSYDSFEEIGQPGFKPGMEYILKLGSGGGSKDKPSGDERQKSNYGVIDPDNITAGGANDYRDRFMTGFAGPLTVNDRVITEPGNMNGPTDQSVDFRLTSTASGARRVVVPIVDVPPEVKLNNSHNASAETVYDIQGTDHPDGVYRPDQYAFGSAVRIIGFAEFELVGESSYTRDGTDVSEGDSGDLGTSQTGQVRGTFVGYIIKPGEIPLQ